MCLRPSLPPHQTSSTIIGDLKDERKVLLVLPNGFKYPGANARRFSVLNDAENAKLLVVVLVDAATTVTPASAFEMGKAVTSCEVTPSSSLEITSFNSGLW